jgi:hypothetical protein
MERGRHISERMGRRAHKNVMWHSRKGAPLMRGAHTRFHVKVSKV